MGVVVVTIAAHVRRGDVWDNPRTSNYVTRDDYYFRILAALRGAVGLLSQGRARADVHAFTSCTGKARYGELSTLMAGPYAARNITLHMTNELANDADADADTNGGEHANKTATDLVLSDVGLGPSHERRRPRHGGVVVQPRRGAGQPGVRRLPAHVARPPGRVDRPDRDLWDVTLHKARPKFLSDEGLARYLAASQPA